MQGIAAERAVNSQLAVCKRNRVLCQTLPARPWLQTSSFRGGAAPARMPRIRTAVCDVHDEAECRCYKQSNPAAQSLEELGYLKSACAAAQQGNEAKLQIILEKHPQAISSDGSEGKYSGCLLDVTIPALTSSSHHRRHWLYPAPLCSQSGTPWHGELASGQRYNARR